MHRNVRFIEIRDMRVAAVVDATGQIGHLISLSNTTCRRPYLRSAGPRWLVERVRVVESIEICRDVEGDGDACCEVYCSMQLLNG